MQFIAGMRFEIFRVLVETRFIVSYFILSYVPLTLSAKRKQIKYKKRPFAYALKLGHPKIHSAPEHTKHNVAANSYNVAQAWFGT